MTFLYDAGYSVVLLRPKNEVKPLTQSAEKWICAYGEMACVKFSGIYSPRSRVPLCTGVLIANTDCSLVLGIKNFNTKRPGGGGKRIKN